MRELHFSSLLAALILGFAMSQTLVANETSVTQRPDDAAQWPDRITTLDGKSYEKVVLDRVEPDGLLVQFTPAGGGSGSAKLKFRNLPTALRERYSYDASEAADYEAAQARGAAVWHAGNAAWAEQRQAALAEQAAWERQRRAEAEAHRAEAEQAKAESARDAQNQPSSNYPWWTPGFYSEGILGGRLQRKDFDVRRHEQGSKASQWGFPPCQPSVGFRQSHVSPFMGPMRPSGR